MALWLFEGEYFLMTGKADPDGTKTKQVIVATIPCCAIWAQDSSHYRCVLKKMDTNYPELEVFFKGVRISHCPFCGKYFSIAPTVSYGLRVSKAARVGLRKLYSHR